MKGLVQRVNHASVSVDDVRIGQIEQGLLLFLGIEKHDDIESAKHLCQRVTRFRLFPDDSGRMNLSVSDIEGSILVVPQFTLVANTNSGNRPGFSGAAAPEKARSLCQAFTENAKATLGAERVETGQFGADMKVSLTNDGPVTFLLETPD
jgi:D-tyrosyl-tRNA(Tyr) deacylase